MRRESDYTVSAEGRDKGKVFHLREMAASQAEKWAARLFLAFAKSGIDIPDEISGAGWAGIAVMGAQKIPALRWEDAEPLMDEMMECVTFVPDPKAPAITRRIIEDDIEDVQTRGTLRLEVLSLHVGFSILGRLSERREAARVARLASQNMSTSQEQ